MHVASLHIKRAAGTRAAGILLILLLAGSVCLAQQRPDRLPDSVSTTVEETKDTALYEGTGALPAMPDTAVPASLRTLPDTTIRRLKKEKEFAYANDPAYWTNEQEKTKKSSKEENGFTRFMERILNSKGFAWFIYTLMGAILLFALYKIIADNNLRLFYRRPAKLKAAEDEAGEWKEENLDEKLQRALQETDHRMATRYLYLKTLKQLDDASLIQHQTRATGQDYVNQMSSHPQGGSFRFLNAAYERVWYGGFPIDQQQFSKLYGYFQEFYKSTGHPAT